VLQELAVVLSRQEEVHRKVVQIGSVRDTSIDSGLADLPSDLLHNVICSEVFSIQDRESLPQSFLEHLRGIPKNMTVDNIILYPRSTGAEAFPHRT